MSETLSYCCGVALALVILQAVFFLAILNMGGILPVLFLTLLLVGAWPRGALPPWSLGTSAGLSPAGTGALPQGNIASFPPIASVLAVCLVLPLPNTMPPTLYILPDFFCLQNLLYPQFFNLLYHPFPCPLKA